MGPHSDGGERREVQGHREDDKGQGLWRTLVHAHLGPNLLVEVESNLPVAKSHWDCSMSFSCV